MSFKMDTNIIFLLQLQEDVSIYTQDVQVDQTNCRDTFGNPFGMNHRFY